MHHELCLLIAHHLCFTCLLLSIRCTFYLHLFSCISANRLRSRYLDTDINDSILGSINIFSLEQYTLLTLIQFTQLNEFDVSAPWQRLIAQDMSSPEDIVLIIQAIFLANVNG